MATLNCIDIAAHIISDEGIGVPSSANEMFYLLEENGYINRELAEKIVRSVGFRNLMVHEYGKIELKVVLDGMSLRAKYTVWPKLKNSLRKIHLFTESARMTIRQKH